MYYNDKSILLELFYFLRDMLYTLLQFALHPLQYLFFHLPKTYDKICLFFSALRNIIPTKKEIHHTILYWTYNYLKFCLILNKFFIKILIDFCYKLLCKAEYILVQYNKS